MWGPQVRLWQEFERLKSYGEEIAQAVGFTDKALEAIANQKPVKRSAALEEDDLLPF